MARAIGTPKTGGRQKGTPNKSRADLLEICDRHGFSPFEGLIDLYKRSRDEGIKLSCLKECAKYIYPQVRSMELSGSENGAIQPEVDAQHIIDELNAIVEIKVERLVGERRRKD